jgi:uncharacterized membrane protein
VIRDPQRMASSRKRGGASGAAPRGRRLGGGASGTALGATAGHVVAGMSRSDLKDLGELLDAGASGLIVVAATDVEERVEAAIQRGKDVIK